MLYCVSKLKAKWTDLNLTIQLDSLSKGHHKTDLLDEVSVIEKHKNCMWRLLQ